MSAWEGARLAFPLTPQDVAEVVRASVPAQAGGAVGSAGPAGCPDAGAVVAIGAFDGVHRGHRLLIRSAVAEAHARDAAALVVTFDPDPSEVIAGDAAERRLLAVSDRVAFCRSLGVDDVLVLSFDRTLAQRSPQEFIDVLEDLTGPLACVHVGDNFHFGHHGAGDVDTLRALGAARGFAVVDHPLHVVGGSPVSSSRVRALLAEGKVEQATELLGRCHFVRGSVLHGRGEGTSFGFPTANVRTDARSCMPCEGVYACIVSDGTHAWPAAANVGAPPTFASGRDESFLEANLIGFEGDLYGSDLAVVFVSWLRASRPFSSLAELERVVLDNIDWVRRNVGDSCVEVCR